MFHVKHTVGCAEELDFGRERCHDELAAKSGDARDEAGQAIAVEFGGGVVEKEGWEGAGLLVDELELGEGHRGSDQLLLSA